MFPRVTDCLRIYGSIHNVWVSKWIFYDGKGLVNNRCQSAKDKNARNKQNNKSITLGSQSIDVSICGLFSHLSWCYLTNEGKQESSMKEKKKKKHCESDVQKKMQYCLKNLPEVNSFLDNVMRNEKLVFIMDDAQPAALIAKECNKAYNSYHHIY